MAIAALLRAIALGNQPPWTDECATIAFSLGNGFLDVPLDRLISLEQLLQPLQVRSGIGVGEAIARLMAESTHPPAYFALSHLWLQWFSTDGELASVAVARSLAALFGILTVPVAFALNWLAFGSLRAAHLAAAVMAMSPFGVFLGREARHYTLSILLVTLSLCCLVVAMQRLQQHKPLPIKWCLLWILTNSLGLAVHYFFAFALAAQAVVVGWFWWLDLCRNLSGKHQPWRSLALVLQSPLWQRLYAVAAGSAVAGLAWLPAIASLAGSRLTSWVSDGDLLIFDPPLRLIAWFATMLTLLPTDAATIPIPGLAIAGLGTVGFLVWAIPQLYQGLRQHMEIQTESQTDSEPGCGDRRLALQTLGGFTLAFIALLLVCTYVLRKDVTLAPRFCFVGFPAIAALIGAGLAGLVDASDRPRPSTQRPVFWILFMCLCGSLMVVSHLGYLQHHRSQKVARVIAETSQIPVLVATTHKHHGQTGRLMGVAWELRRLRSRQMLPPALHAPQFLLAHKALPPASGQDPAQLLLQTVAAMPKPVDVWSVNFHAPVILEDELGCIESDRRWDRLDGYRLRLYHCPQ